MAAVAAPVRVVVAVVVASAAAVSAAAAGRAVSASVDQTVVVSGLPSKECRRRRWPEGLQGRVHRSVIGLVARDHRSATVPVVPVVRVRRSAIGPVVLVVRVRRAAIVARGQAARVVRVARRWAIVARGLAVRRR